MLIFTDQAKLLLCNDYNACRQYILFFCAISSCNFPKIYTNCYKISDFGFCYEVSFSIFTGI